MKKLAIVFALLIIIVGGAMFFLVSNLNSIVAGAIEKHGSEVTETNVGVTGVEISLKEGRGSISGLTVDSPRGYEAKQAFSLGNITIDIDLGSVREEPIVIDEVRIEAPVVFAEVKKDGSSNITELRSTVESYAGTSGGKSGGGGDAADAKRIRIKSFVFEKGRVELDATELGVDKKAIDLPEIRLTNVGGANGGTPDVIAKTILTAVAKQVATEVAQSEASRQLQDAAADKAKDLLKKIGD